MSKHSAVGAVGAVTRYGRCKRGIPFQIPAEEKYFTLPTTSTYALKSTEAPTEWVSGALSPGVKRSNVGDTCKKDYSYMCTS